MQLRPLRPKWALFPAGLRKPWTRQVAYGALIASLIVVTAILLAPAHAAVVGSVWIVVLSATGAAVCATEARALHLRASLNRRTSRVTLALDILLLVTVGSAVAWYLLRRNAADHSALWRSASVLTPLALALIAVPSLGSALGLRHRWKRTGTMTFGAGLCLAAIGAAVQKRAASIDIAVPIVTGALGALLMLLGILLAISVEKADHHLAKRQATRRAHSPVFAVVSLVLIETIAFGLALEAGGRELAGVVVALFIATLLVIARQAILVREIARRDAERARAESETRFRSLVQHSTDLITILDGADTIRYLSPAIARVFGYGIDELEGTPLRDLVHDDDVVQMLGFLSDAVKPAARTITGHWRMRDASGGWCRVETVAVNLLGDPTVAGIVLTTRDVTHRVTLEEQLVHRAFHDELTGLANRALFTNRVEQALLRAARDAQRTAVLFLDLDDFKEINDSLGHAAGDSLLNQGADRLRACLRSGDTAARLGGDEFAVLLEGCRDDGEEAMHVAERIANAFARPFDLEDRETLSTASIGVAVSTGKETVDDLLRNADLAMYLAKKRGKARVERFAAHMQQEVVERLDLLADLRYAIERDQLQLEYQPIVDLATRRVRGLETLVRWDHPRRGRIPPADFIPLAEQSGLIVSIGRWVMLHACAHARHWSRSLPDLVPVTVTVNLSARQMGDENLIDDVANAIRVAGLQRDQLVLELTESTLLANSEETVGILTSLKSLGVRLAIDDFGTGYSSLSYLHRFPVDILKIDKSFVDGVAGGPGANALATAVIALGHSLGLQVVAEGIESEIQHEVLQSLGCNSGQGYLYSVPLPPADVLRYLNALGQYAVPTRNAEQATAETTDDSGGAA